MKNLLVIAMLTIFYILCIQNISAQDINWNNKSDWNTIKSEAKAKEKFIFIDCYATWCVPCKRMDKEVYTNDAVANFFNSNFVSLKLQMDSTSKDSKNIISMYGLAKKINDTYHVKAFPTFLFFTSEGILINKVLGFKDTLEFIRVAKEAMSPKRIVYYKQLQRYEDGERDYSTMRDLAVFVGDVLGDKSLAKQIANDYITHVLHKELLNISSIYFIRDVAKNRKFSEDLAKEYLKNMPEDSAFTEANLELISNYSQVVTTSDYLFQLLKNDSVRMDSSMKRKGWTKEILARIIVKEEMYDKLIKDGKPIFDSEPQWTKFTSDIKSRYSFIDADKLVLDFQIAYYRSFKPDWQKWAEYKQKRIDMYPPDPKNGIAITIELNDGGAWDAFLNCNDKNVLRETISWIDLAIKLSKEGNPKSYPSAYMDTKANVLYKIGNTSEAIKIENEIVRQLMLMNKIVGNNRENEAIKEYNQILEDMTEGKPTYLEQGAKWDDSTLPKRQDSQISSSK